MSQDQYNFAFIVLHPSNKHTPPHIFIIIPLW